MTTFLLSECLTSVYPAPILFVTSILKSLSKRNSISSTINFGIEFGFCLFYYIPSLYTLMWAGTITIPIMCACFILMLKEWKQKKPSNRNYVQQIMFWKTHTKFIRFIMKSDDWFVSSFISVMLGINIPINAFLMTYMRTSSIDNIMKPAFVIIICMQLFGFLILLSYPAKVNKAVNKSAKNLNDVHLSIARHNVWLKWKYLSSIETLTSKRQIGYHLFSHGAITFSLMTEVKICKMGFHQAHNFPLILYFILI